MKVVNETLFWVYEWLLSCNRVWFGLFFSFWAFIHPIHKLIFAAIVAVSIDYVTGNIAAFTESRRGGKKYRFSSEKTWKTICKLGLTIIGTGFAWMLDTYVFPINLGVTSIFASFILGAEFVSFLENASTITGWNIFIKAKTNFTNKLKDKTDIEL